MAIHPKIAEVVEDVTGGDVREFVGGLALEARGGDGEPPEEGEEGGDGGGGREGAGARQAEGGPARARAWGGHARGARAGNAGARGKEGWIATSLRASR